MLLIVSTIVSIVLFKLALQDENENYYAYLTAALLFGIWDVFCVVFWFCTLIGVKFKTFVYNGHEISLYLGWSCAYLLLDGIVVDKHTGSFYGANPLECDLNGEKVCLKVGAFTLNSYTLRVGNKILH